ncbi:MAG TPA: peptide-methionine (S)-S-oxide reductase MsrA [Rhizomicrobium sp.]|jgi:peptide-methionine (S)-S-oxide reductase|nr:peptide-methionine (S)-S-oxide reductase MsrA [Rhizomicrobium sp.]
MNLKPLYLVMAAAAAAVLAPFLTMRASAGDLDKEIPAAAADPANPASSEVAVLAGGCFWGQQGLFEHVKGVTRVVAGYSGGERATARYGLVSTSTTGHAESVQITFDPHQVTFGQILRIYFSVAHDPTEVNRQGPDEGTQYRSEIFAASPEQEATAKAYIAQLDTAHVFAAPIATRVEPLKGFYPAEDYHQDYLVQNPDSSYIRINDLPKIEALKQVWPDFYRARPVLLAEK